MFAYFLYICDISRISNNMCKRKHTRNISRWKKGIHNTKKIVQSSHFTWRQHVSPLPITFHRLSVNTEELIAGCAIYFHDVWAKSSGEIFWTYQQCWICECEYPLESWLMNFTNDVSFSVLWFLVLENRQCI